MTTQEEARGGESRWIDQLIVATMGGLALFSMGQAIDQIRAALVLIGILIVGCCMSFFVGRLQSNKEGLWLDGAICTLAAVLAFAFQGLLNPLLPGNPFPDELWATGFLSWLIALGSFGIWRDAPRMFQAVPGIALFGLIGIYDTYRPSTIFFFGFLICLALLFGRAHARSMLKQAFKSGFSRIDEGMSLRESELEQDSLLRSMRRGPWKWMAGPEWAVASGAVVILLSAFGAPLIQESTKGIVTNVAINIPNRIKKAVAPTTTSTTDDLFRVGGGPRTLVDTIVGSVATSHAGYLSTEACDQYTARGWTISPQNLAPGYVADDPSGSRADPLAEQQIKSAADLSRPVKVPFKVTLLTGSFTYFPIPGAIQSISQPSNAVVLANGSAPTTIDGDYSSIAQGISVEEEGVNDQLPSIPNIKAFPDGDGIASSQRVKDLAMTITAGIQSDWDKAEAIKHYIEHNCSYNLKSEATPDRADPIEYFLFTSHQGYCDLFASAMVALARENGMSARYVVGYLTEDDDRGRDGSYLIRMSRAHAWCEIHFKGLGWVPFDATEGAVDITPKDGQASSFWKVIGGVAVFGIALLGIGAAIILGPKRLKSARARDPRVIRRKKLGQLYNRFVRTLERRSKLKRDISLSPDAWLAKVSPLLTTGRAECVALNSQFVECFYGPGEVGEAQLAELESRLRELKTVLR